jgi:hypothetical protein
MVLDFGFVNNLSDSVSEILQECDTGRVQIPTLFLGRKMLNARTVTTCAAVELSATGRLIRHS